MRRSKPGRNHSTIEGEMIHPSIKHPEGQRYEGEKKKMNYNSYIKLNKELDEKIATIRKKYLNATDYISDSFDQSRYSASKHNRSIRTDILNENIPNFHSIGKNNSFATNRYQPSKMYFESSYGRTQWNHSFLGY